MNKGMALCVAAVLFASFAHADDAGDVDYLSDVINQRLETQKTGVDVPWWNPETGNRGVITITGTDMRDPAQPCRTYRRTTERLGGPTTIVQGRACRIGEGLWQRTESAAVAAPGPDPAPVARADPEPTEPPPVIPPPGHKPDPDVFFASVPTPSVY